MSTAITRLLRASRREPGSPLNIVWARGNPTSDEALLATHHNFIPIGEPPYEEAFNTPFGVPLDLVLTQSTNRQYDLARTHVLYMNLPHITVEHEVPDPRWGAPSRRKMGMRRGDIHLFASPEIAEAWGGEGEPIPITTEGWDEVIRRADIIPISGVGHA